MKIKTYGTRGSTPIARPGAMRYGGNTTCIRVFSKCLPEGTALVMDGGSGLVPLSHDMLKEGPKRIVFLMTHYHHDHTQGFPLSPHTFIGNVAIDLYGPTEHGIGPKEMMESIMAKPFFPVDFERVKEHFGFHPINDVGAEVLLIHPDSGVRRLSRTDYERCLGNSVRTDDGGSLDIPGSLVIHMHKTAHPEYTVSYRLEEKPTGKVLVVLTDHENTYSLPKDLRGHILGADLLVQDAQYLRRQYEERTSGFGHGTGDYAAMVMKEGGVGRLAITHHDPMSDDDDVEDVLREAREWLMAEGAGDLADNVFACADYQEIEV